MEISPGKTWGSMVREVKSPRPSTVQPKKSNPRPRLVTVAGAKALTEVKTGSGSLMVRMGREGREKLHRRWMGLCFDDCNRMRVKGLNGDWWQIAIAGRRGQLRECRGRWVSG
ncbi:uncharacterized protein LOC126609163 isoform X2 [Malus sylvestris]|nr:uncharacterized protein LOC126609163 isoform X2 [Malus sylvestris]